jgi:hypothetical protein
MTMVRSQPSCLVAAIATLAFAMLSPCAHAQAAAASANAPAVSADAQAVLDRMTATLKTLKHYAVSAEITRDEVLDFGYKLQHHETARMWVQGPDRLRVEVDGDIKHRNYYYDGKVLTMWAPDQQVYSQVDAPPTLDALVQGLLAGGVELPLIDMLYQGHAGNLAEGAKAGVLVGQTTTDGVATDHLAFRQADVDWQLWVDRGEQALPRKLLVTTRYAVGEPQYQASLTWDTAPRAEAGTFEFTPPKGASKIPYHGKLFATGGDAP